MSVSGDAITWSGFGIRPPREDMVAWGARAIIDGRGNGRRLDLLGDRQSNQRPDGQGEAFADLHDRINDLVLPQLRRMVADYDPYTTTNDVLTKLSIGGLWVSLRPGWGYLYIGVWPEDA